MPTRVPKPIRMMRERKGSYHATLKELEKCCKRRDSCPYHWECRALWDVSQERWPLEKEGKKDPRQYYNDEQRYSNWLATLERRSIANARGS